MITTWEQHYNNGHLGMAKSRGEPSNDRTQQLLGNQIPTSRLFVEVKPTDLAGQWLWGIQHASEAKQHTPDQIRVVSRWALIKAMYIHTIYHVYVHIVHIFCDKKDDKLYVTQCNFSITWRTFQNRKNTLTVLWFTMALMAVPVDQVVCLDKYWMDCVK